MEETILNEIDIHDRVYEAYYGLLGDNMMIKTQERIHWICNNVSGNDILDVGCSQGILPLLLGREGKKVTGLDISKKAIDEANSQLIKEELHTQRNISFLHTNFMINDFEGKYFDTIIIAEVLEHLLNPKQFIDKSNELLREEGTLIITVPFGINDFIDHKKTFYLYEPLKMLEEMFEIIDIHVLGKWIGVVAKKSKNNNFKETLEDNIKLLETSFLKIERSLLNELNDKKNKLMTLNDKNKENNLRLKKINEEKRKLEAERLEKEYIQKIEAERLEKEKIEKEYIQKIEVERLEKEKIEKECIQKIEVERLEKEKIEKEYLREFNLKNDFFQKNKLLEKKIEKLNFKKIDITNKYYSILESSSYKFGYLLLHNTRTIKSILKLPMNILQIKKESSKNKLLNHTCDDKSQDDFSIKDFQRDILKGRNQQEVKKLIDKNIIDYPNSTNIICKKVFSLFKDSNILMATEYGEIYGKSNLNDLKFLKVLASRLYNIKNYDRAYFYHKHVFKLTKDSSLLKNILEYENKEDLDSWINLAKNNKKEEIEVIIEKIKIDYEEYIGQIYKFFADLFTNINLELSIELMKQALSFSSSDNLYLKLFDLYIRKGKLKSAIDCLPNNIKSKSANMKKLRWEENINLINRDFPFTQYLENYCINKTNKIFYLLHNSLPFHSGGYATRAHGLMKGVNTLGNYEIIGITRLGYPKDMSKINSFDEILDVDIIDDNKYYRLKSDDRPGILSYSEYVTNYSKEIKKLFETNSPFVIHGASNFYNGLATVNLAKQFGVKSIYEIRGLWEITRVSKEPEFETTELYQLNKKMETEAAKGADLVITITSALKDEMVRRGIDKNKIRVVPNGVDTARFLPLKKDKELLRELNLEDKVVIGYVGSIVEYEGLDYLVDAVNILVNKGLKNLSVLIVGDGVVLDDIKDLVKKYNLTNYFNFTGRIPHEEVEKYYSLIDITPFPRKSLPVTEMVSPLKPFEAMSMEKAILSSDVNALTEIINDKKTGLLFKKDDIKDLSLKLESLILDEKLRLNLGQEARRWVVENRDWKVIAKEINDIYNSLEN